MMESGELDSEGWELEAMGAAEDLLSRYDPATDEWSVPKVGRFWEAIKRAHDLGLRGQGHKVAVIDSACDYTVPRIRRQTGGKPKFRRLHGEPTIHGTAVVLLIGAVAPDCEICVYEVTRGGLPDRSLFEEAVREAANSDAEIICISLGSAKEAVLSRYYRLASQMGFDLEYLQKDILNGGKSPFEEETSPCSICDATSSAASKGKMVFAAAGNKEDKLCCPARSPDVVSVGFVLEEASVQELRDGSAALEWRQEVGPSYSQSALVDFTIRQLPGALGSSFACPLAVGAAALGIQRNTLLSFLKSSKFVGLAEMVKHYRRPTSPQENVESIRGLYKEGFNIHPHQHLGPGTDEGCFECSIFSEQLYVDGGLYFLETGSLDLAEQWLRTARWFAPRSADAAANLGRTIQALAERTLATTDDIAKARRMLDEAIHHYQEALNLRSAFSVYQRQLDEIYYLRSGLKRKTKDPGVEEPEIAQICAPVVPPDDAEAQVGPYHEDYSAQGVPQAYREAAKWFRKGADQGYPLLQFWLGALYYRGEGLPQDFTEAVNWYRRAAGQGYAPAQYNLGDCYYQGQGVPQNYVEATRWWRKAADQRYLQAQYNLGTHYHRGEGVPQDFSEAAKWYRKAADRGYARAQNNLGELYQNGKGLCQDYGESAKLFREAADQGFAPAQYNLGHCYYRSQGVPQDYAEAANWYLKAARQGIAQAQTNLALMYRDGLGVARDYTEAVKWFRTAAEQVDALARNYLGCLYRDGLGVPRDYAEAVKWFRTAAEQGLALAQYNLGVMYRDGKGVRRNYNAAIKLLGEAAEQGLAEAQNSLGSMYKNGSGGTKSHGKAVLWFTRAAEQGLAQGQDNMGVMYRDGKGVQQDDNEAVKWFRKAAEHGFARSQNHLGWMYENGRGVTNDCTEAVNWYRKAAEQGLAQAQYNLGVMYRDGKGVRQDFKEAVEWFKKSAKQGYALARKNLKNLRY